MCSNGYWLIIAAVITLSENFSTEDGEILDLSQFLQPDDVGEYQENPPVRNSNSCTRKCKMGTPSRICYYRFDLENYSVLSTACQDCVVNTTHCYNPQCIAADGYERGISVINRRLPGPSIQVCQGDRIIVDIRNMMPAKTTAIHWHGLFQRGTPWSDGVPMLTQCPILEGTTYRYDFYADPPGTMFWHSHDGVQKTDGIQGTFIIRRPKKYEPNGGLYDYDLTSHVMMITDWYHIGSDQHFPGLNKPETGTYGIYFLIKGRGRYTDPHTGRRSTTPYSVFLVTQGKRYRFRIVGGICSHCHVSLTIQAHNITIIAVDGNAVKPVVVNNLEIHSGQRYDVVIHAKQEVSSYWIKVRALGICEGPNYYQLAILKYRESTDLEPTAPVPENEDFNSSVVFPNPISTPCIYDKAGVCMNQLETAEKFNRRIITSKPNVTIPVTFGYFHPKFEDQFQLNYYHRYYIPIPGAAPTMLHVNNIHCGSLSSPILTQPEDIPFGAVCPTGSEGLPVCNDELCSCYPIYKIPLYSLVEFILIDSSRRLDHPFHLHGYSSVVIATGRAKNGTYNVSDIHKLMMPRINNQSFVPLIKDTIAVPKHGFAVLRVFADNPGYWMFHCHILNHHVAGMCFVIQVGTEEDIPKAPVGLYSKCGNSLPPVYIKNPNNTSQIPINYYINYIILSIIIYINEIIYFIK